MEPRKKIVKAMTCSKNRAKPIKLQTSHSSPKRASSDYVSSSEYEYWLGVAHRNESNEQLQMNIGFT